MVDFDFDNGNGALRLWDARTRAFTVAPAPIRECRNIWWHFRLAGLQPGETVVLNVEHDSVAGECNPVYSADGLTWHRFTDAQPPYRQRFDTESVRVARNIPYAYGMSLALAKRMKANPCAEALPLCRSEGGRDVALLRFTDRTLPDAGKSLLWFQARQHAFESHSSWVAEGLAEWLASGDGDAAELRRNAIAYVVPIMDADSVFEGGAGKDQAPVDFNRCWPTGVKAWAAVNAVKERLDRETRANPLAVFADLHSPWYPELPHWHLVPGADQAVAEFFGELFAKSLKSLPGANSWRHWYIRHDGNPASPAAADHAMTQWMRGRQGAVCFTMETPHWKDNDGKFITTRGLLDYGRALGLACSAWIREGKE